MEEATRPTPPRVTRGTSGMMEGHIRSVIAAMAPEPIAPAAARDGDSAANDPSGLVAFGQEQPAHPAENPVCEPATVLGLAFVLVVVPAQHAGILDRHLSPQQERIGD